MSNFALRLCRAVFGGVILLCCLTTILAAPREPPGLTATDRTRLAEVFRLNKSLGDEIWHGWRATPFVVLLVTPEYEYLVNHPRPSNDFQKLGYDARLKSDVYYRARVFSPGFLATFPAVNGVSTVVVGRAEATLAKTSTRWLITLFHEHFHQLQDSQPDFYRDVNALGLARGDETGMWMLNFAFPYDDARNNQRYDEMRAALRAALQTQDEPGFRRAAERYLQARRAFTDALAPDEKKYLEFQLWKEGVARYSELRAAEWAARRYAPSRAFKALPDYQTFATDARDTRAGILRELAKLSLMEHRRETFYAVGAGEAMLLDRLRPAWRQCYFAAKFRLEDFFDAERAKVADK